MGKGLVLINTGPGKGKTTASVGLAVRALGQGQNVAFLQFIKNQATGESRFMEAYAAAHPPLDEAGRRASPEGLGGLFYKRMGLGFILDSPSPEDRAKAAEALCEARKLLGGGFELVVLDEICVAVSRGLISPAEVLGVIEGREPSVNLILTGRGCPDEIIAIADTVTEMTVVKHAYQAGTQARRGIEF